MGQRHRPEAGYLLDTGIGRDERDRLESGWPASCHFGGRRGLTLLELIRWLSAGLTLRVGVRYRMVAGCVGRSPRWKREGPGPRGRVARGPAGYVGYNPDP